MTGQADRPAGLALLSERRPDVLHAYLDLLPLLGESLDGRTKELIRIALHVQSGSHAALRCSVARALAESTTPDEIVDVLILTLPELGLNRVADALGVLAEFLEQPLGGEEPAPVPPAGPEPGSEGPPGLARGG